MMSSILNRTPSIEECQRMDYILLDADPGLLKWIPYREANEYDHFQMAR